MKWICKECGSDEIDVMIWVEINKRILEDITLVHRHRKSNCRKCNKIVEIEKAKGDINLGIDFG